MKKGDLFPYLVISDDTRARSKAYAQKFNMVRRRALGASYEIFILFFA